MRELRGGVLYQVACAPHHCAVNVEWMLLNGWGRGHAVKASRTARRLKCAARSGSFGPDSSPSWWLSTTPPGSACTQARRSCLAS